MIRGLIISFATLYCCIAEAKLRASNFIEPVEYFTNHVAQLEQIGQLLKMHKKVIIKGTSGVGKTQIARAYVNQNNDQYDLIWFIDTSKDLNEEFTYLAKEMNKNFLSASEDKLPEQTNSARNEVMRHLTSKKNWLLVFDNLKINQENTISEILSWENNGNIIICTQGSEVAYPTILLQPFNKEDSIGLVKRITNNSNISEQSIEQLVNAFKGYPVLTVQGATFLSSKPLTDIEHYKLQLINANDKLQSSIDLAIKSLSPSAKSLLLQLTLVNNHKLTIPLLEIFASYPAIIHEDLQALNRYGLVAKTNDKYFELHDAIKNSVLSANNEIEIKQCLEDIVDKINTKMPKQIGASYSVIASDDLRNSMEELLNNAEHYKIAVCKVLELRNNLMMYYVSKRDYYNCQLTVDWLTNKEKDKPLSAVLNTEHDKVVYADLVTKIGTYHDFAKSDTKTALSYMSRALPLLKEIKNNPGIVFYVNSQVAQTNLLGARISEGHKALTALEEIYKLHPEVDDWGIFWNVKAKFAIAQGKYDEALVAINKAIETSAHLPRDTFTAPHFIAKAQILNYLGRYKEAYQEAAAIYNQEMAAIREPHEIHARILVHLARASCHLKKEDKALDDIDKSISIYLAHYKIVPEAIKNSIDTKFADALVVKGEVLNRLKRPLEAMEYFELANSIYNNRYQDNKKYMSDVSYLYKQAMQTIKGSNFPGREQWYNIFTKRCTEEFGLDSPEGKEAVEIGKQLNN